MLITVSEISVVNSHMFDIFSQNLFFCSVKKCSGQWWKGQLQFSDISGDYGVDDSDDDGDDGGDDDRAGGEEDVNQETKQEQVAVQLGPSRGLWQYSISTLDDECDDDEEDDGEERNEKQYYCSKLED